jgi:predicted DsbA family dithiol-disulfide isomerase
MADRIKVQYFSDVLCVWAYVAQIRLDELQRRRGDEIDTRHHFVSVFGSTAHRIGEGWSDRGGFEGYASHVAEICGRFPHVELAPEAWREVRPTSSAPAHQLLKALQLHERDRNAGESRFEAAAWAVRCAFFRDARDISHAETLWAIAAECGLPVDDLTTYFDDGRALAGVCRDAELMKELGIEGSPTYVLNDGRQKLYGNLGYKVIEANVEELLHQPTEGASWC